jgi:hypothetical protein
MRNIALCYLVWHGDDVLWDQQRKPSGLTYAPLTLPQTSVSIPDLSYYNSDRGHNMRNITSPDIISFTSLELTNSKYLHIEESAKCEWTQDSTN